MIACVDTQYFEIGSRTAAVLFSQWTDSTAFHESIYELDESSHEYVSGQFYQRELPCILNAVEHMSDDVETIVLDGFVQLGSDRAGLGLKLFQALNERIAVVGVAKNPFRGADNAAEVFRGESRRPLYVTAAGVPISDAASAVARMHGSFRIPTLLKLADRLARGN